MMTSQPYQSKIYISIYVKVWIQKVRSVLLLWTFQTDPLCWKPSLDLCLSGWTLGAAEFGLYIMGELCSAESGTPTASAWSLGLEGALRLGHTTKYPPAPNPFILLCICWEPERKDGDFGVAAKGKGIPGSQKGGCDLCWCCTSSFLSTYLQLPGIQ